MLLYGRGAVRRSFLAWHLLVSLPSWTAGVFWLFAGIYLGSWIIALGEVVNLFSILCRRIGLTRGLPFVILCMAAGKIAGSLYYFASGFQ